VVQQRRRLARRHPGVQLPNVASSHIGGQSRTPAHAAAQHTSTSSGSCADQQVHAMALDEGVKPAAATPAGNTDDVPMRHS
jgi:hypothetical protein